MEMLSLEFDQLVFGLSLVQCFLTMFPSLWFGLVMHFLCHYMLEVCDLFFDFDFYRGLQMRDYANLRRDFEIRIFKRH